MAEEFVPPAPPELRFYGGRERLPPASAVDGERADLLSALRARDARYVAKLRSGRVASPGATEPGGARR